MKKKFHYILVFYFFSGHFISAQVKNDSTISHDAKNQIINECEEYPHEDVDAKDVKKENALFEEARMEIINYEMNKDLEMYSRGQKRWNCVLTKQAGISE